MTLRAIFRNDKNFIGNLTFESPHFATAGATLTFEHGKTYYYDQLGLSGEAGNLTTVQSDLAGSRFTFDGSGATVSYLNVKDSQCNTSNIYANYSVDLGNTDTREGDPRWVFTKTITAFYTES